MIQEGASALSFSLPAVTDGGVGEVALADHLGENVVVLAFYPGDFNPACDEESTGLDELDLFTMQRDVTVLGVSGDSVFSHRAFAAEYDLGVTLLADVTGTVTEAYGMAAAAEGYLARRGVVVLDPDGTVTHVWADEDPERLPDVDRVRKAVESAGGAATACARYRVGHAHYVEGRRAFTSAMNGYEDGEWMMAQTDFSQAEGEFKEAMAAFDAAVRFADDEDHAYHFERASRKAEALGRAANWLADSASDFASGEGRSGERLRRDAEAPLETVRGLPEPVPPEEFPPGEAADPQRAADEAGIDASLELNVDVPDPEAGGEEGGVPDAGPTTADRRRPEGTEPRIGQEPATAADEEETEEAAAEETIPDDELAEITAEVEAQGGDEDDPKDGGSHAADAAEVDEPIEGDAELDLTDPTEGEDDDADEDDEEAPADPDLDGGDHGVPDSL